MAIVYGSSPVEQPALLDVPPADPMDDLANLPQFLCRQDDIVLVERKPSVEFLSSIKQAGFPLPEYVERSADLEERTGTVVTHSAAT